MEGNVYKLLNSGNPVSRELRARIKKLMKPPTDHIEMSDTDRMKLIRLFFDIDPESVMTGEPVPADIVIANTIPIRNFVMTGTRGDDYAYDRYVFQFSIFDFNDCIPIVYTDMNADGLINPMSLKIVENVDNMEYMGRDDSDLIVGVVTVTEHPRDNSATCYKFSIPIIGHHDTLCAPSILFDMDFIYQGHTTHVTINNKNEDIVKMLDDLGDVVTTDGHIAIETLYAIECALLNPVILNVFNRRTTTMPISSGKQTKHNKRATIRYVKKHYITADEIHEELKSHGFTRKALVWYVTGHWREYKNGKRIFIQGYWKGALRKSKEGEIRDRELIMDNTTDLCLKEG